MRSINARRGVALPDALVLSAIVVVAVGILFPALRTARDAASTENCAENLRKLGQAVLAFEAATGELPNGWYGPNYSADNPSIYSGWGTRLLPHLGEQEKRLYERYSWKHHYYDPVNQPVISTPLEVFHCPAAPPIRTMTTLTNIQTNETFENRQAATSDYNIPRGYMEYRVPRVDNRVPSALMGLSADGAERRCTNIIPRRDLVTDGMSSSIMLTEQGGRPEYYVKREKQPDPSKIFHAGFIGPWAGWGSNWARCGTPDGTREHKGVSTCLVNCNNGFGIYSFHEGGANTLFMDGSTRFLAESIEPTVLFALLSRAGGEITSPSDY